MASRDKLPELCTVPGRGVPAASEVKGGGQAHFCFLIHPVWCSVLTDDPTHIVSLDSDMASSGRQDLLLPFFTCTSNLGGVGVAWSCDFP